LRRPFAVGTRRGTASSATAKALVDTRSLAAMQISTHVGVAIWWREGKGRKREE